MKRNEKGVTLIALVVTIVVLLILAGVSISTLTGENSLIKQSKSAKEETEEEEEKEKVKLAVIKSASEGNDTIIENDDLDNELQEQFNKNFELIDNKDNSFLITIKDSKRMYYVNEDGKVIDNENILKITSEEELNSFRDKVNNGDSFINKAAILMNDITLSEDWIPIGYVSDENVVEFNGDFNGLNHSINDFNINNSEKSYQGLFSKAGNLARINSVVIRGSVTGAKYVGTIVGYNEGKIRNCGNEASVISQYELESNTCIGGIAGYNYNGNLNGCYNKGQVSSPKFSSGGIVGKSEGGTIKNCYNTAKITAETGEAGGICGTASGTNFDNVYNLGNIIISTRSETGGIAGIAKNNSKISNAYNIGLIQGRDNMGGIVGTIEKKVIIEKCYNKSNISGNATISGIVGYIANFEDIKIDRCYHYGNIEGVNGYTGTITGRTNYETVIQNCEWYTDNQEYYNNMIGKTSAKFNENIDMKNVLEVVNGDNFFVSNNDNNNPKLYWE